MTNDEVRRNNGSLNDEEDLDLEIRVVDLARVRSVVRRNDRVETVAGINATA